MKYLKMLGLAAAAAAALMAFAGSASATVLCTENQNPCPVGKDEPPNTLISATSSHTQLTASFGTVTCKKNEVGGETTNTGGPTSTVEGPVESLVFDECNGKVVVKEKGTLEVHAIGGGNGTLTSKNAAVTVELFGVHCVYGTTATGTNLGTVTGGNPATVDINATVVRKEGGFFCPGTAIWEGTYTINTPKPLWVVAS
jgi:hypothetical protein